MQYPIIDLLADVGGESVTGKNLLAVSTVSHPDINYSDNYYNIYLTTNNPTERRLFGNWGIQNAESLGLQDGIYTWSYTSISVDGGATCSVVVRVSEHGESSYVTWNLRTPRQIHSDDKFFILLYFSDANTTYKCKIGIQIELGSTATNYEPYFSITFPQISADDIAHRLKLPMLKYYPHAVIEALQTVKNGNTLTYEQYEVLKHYLTPLEIGGI